MSETHKKSTRAKVTDQRLLIIGERAKNIRKSMGLTQTDIALRMGSGKPVVSILERGLLNPTLSTFMQLCNALEVEPEDLLHDLPKSGTKRDSITN
jgi:transcriptional regulator with XRE-family HTH domain